LQKHFYSVLLTANAFRKNIMTLYKNKYRSETTRLQDWDYSWPGYYFITANTKNRVMLFGHVEDKKMILNEYGKIVEKCWFDLSEHYDNLRLDEFVVMPDHIHCIMHILSEHDIDSDFVGTGLKPVPTKSESKRHGLFEFVRALKSFSARRINESRKTPGIPVWQTRFWDRVVRDRIELYYIRKYIMDNPAKWEEKKAIR